MKASIREYLKLLKKLNGVASARLRVMVGRGDSVVAAVDEREGITGGKADDRETNHTQISIFSSSTVCCEGFSRREYHELEWEEDMLNSKFSVFPCANNWNLHLYREGKLCRFHRRMNGVSIELILNFPEDSCGLIEKTHSIGAFLPLLERMILDIPLRSEHNHGVHMEQASLTGGNAGTGEGGRMDIISGLGEVLRMDPPFIGCSPAIYQIKQKMLKVSGSNMPVLIEGESGTGKEIIARNIHRISNRSRRNCVIVNCMEIPSSLLQGEIFGHSRGSFTGASRDRAGLVEKAAGGTMFIDEIGELPMPSQAALLRVLQEGEVRRIGESSRRKIDVRFIFATNKKLSDLVTRGDFRKDLYFRIRGVHFEIPPLRERREDIIPLAQYFLTKAAKAEGREPLSISFHVTKKLIAYHWPGNVRELKNEMKCLHLFNSDAKVIKESMLPEHIRGEKVYYKEDSGNGNSLSEAIKKLEKRMIKEALRKSGGNRTRAAQTLNISRQGLLKKLKRLGMHKDFPH